MTKNLTFSAAIFTLLLFATQSILAYEGDENNKIDARGNRQGYWVIKAYMTNERDYKPDATVEEGSYLDNRREGLWKKYWPNGKIKSEINYSLGKPWGEYKIFYENGQMEEHANWQAGKNVGQFKRYYSNGQPQQIFFFTDNGRRNGMQKYFYENGQLALEVNVVNGNEEGLCKRYNESGKLIEEKTFVAGSLKEGSIREYEDAVAQTLVKPDVYNEEVGKQSTTATDKPNAAQLFKPNGYNVLYDENGMTTQAGTFKNGRLWNGKWYRYNSSGILIRIEIYREGQYIGTGVIEDEVKQ